ncbi:CRE-SRH-210 protein [Caenorhabditis remanei]|uniref:CRE-SRH-210 protein n=1 Tax=Caenorhabditis remanei TaxID=31234 RepID=E3LHS9_CAERE|nr:CRE-SRH-210 protein [Caenorhabditis remanei]
MVDCQDGHSFLETIKFVSIVFHCLTVIEVPVHMYTAWVILFKTPESMNSVKWHMFNVHFWSASLDISVSFLTAPYLLFPHIAGYGAGFLMYLGVDPFVQTTFVVILIGCTVISIAVLFENRYTILASSNRFWYRVRKSIIGVFYIVAWTYFIPFQSLIPNQAVAAPIIFEKLPSLHCFYTGPVFVIALDVTIMVWATAAKMFFEFLFIGALGVLTFISITSQNKSVSLSRKTLALQKRFFMSIIIQTAIPTTIIAIPLLCCAISLLQGHYSQAMNNVCFLIISNHGLVTTFAILLIHKPYRDAIFPCLRRERKITTDIISTVLPTVD